LQCRSLRRGRPGLLSSDRIADINKAADGEYASTGCKAGDEPYRSTPICKFKEALALFVPAYARCLGVSSLRASTNFRSLVVPGSDLSPLYFALEN